MCVVSQGASGPDFAGAFCYPLGVSQKSGRRPSPKTPDKPAPKQDVVLIRGVTDEGDVAVLRARDDRVEAGLVRPIEEGQPLSGEVVKLKPRKEFPLLCDVSSHCSATSRCRSPRTRSTRRARASKAGGTRGRRRSRPRPTGITGTRSGRSRARARATSRTDPERRRKPVRSPRERRRRRAARRLGRARALRPPLARSAPSGCSPPCARTGLDRG